MSEKISINIVVLNGKKYTQHCLDAILAQTYPHEFIEINILDNGSVDSTVEIIENLSSAFRDSRFVKFFLLKNKENDEDERSSVDRLDMHLRRLSFEG